MNKLQEIAVLVFALMIILLNSYFHHQEIKMMLGLCAAGDITVNRAMDIITTREPQKR